MSFTQFSVSVCQDQVLSKTNEVVVIPKNIISNSKVNGEVATPISEECPQNVNDESAVVDKKLTNQERKWQCRKRNIK